MTIHLSSAAAKELRGRTLRIAFMTGCGGSGYRLSYGDPLEGDAVVTVDSVRIALDSMAASQLDGASIGYDSADDGFVLEHPNAVTAVWCG